MTIVKGIDLRAFSLVYREAVEDVLPFLTRERLDVIGRHNPGWRPGRFDFPSYLKTSEVRYVAALAAFDRNGGQAADGRLRVLDVGGFMGALPLALARLGARVTLSEKYDYYDGAFDDLRAFLTEQGVEVWDADLSEPLDSPPDGGFHLIAAMAILEHLPSSPRALLVNARTLLAKNGRLLVDVPNIAYWPNRVGLLRGVSPLPPIADVYDSEPPYTGHHHEYTVDDLKHVLTWSGLTVDEVVTLNYTPWTDGGLLRRIVADWPRKRFAPLREVLLACASQTVSPPRMPSALG
jgi:2-polyprenyl-3-methyl-5-hydroxy-6-metoxy-1,4-benzoquinol methylase